MMNVSLSRADQGTLFPCLSATPNSVGTARVLGSLNMRT